MSVRVKICGLRDPEMVAVAAEAGAAYVGFVFFARSPRSVNAAEARDAALAAPSGLCKVGLFVDPDDGFLIETLDITPLDMIQLHGSETPERVQEISSRTGLPVMKAVAIGSAADLPALAAHEAMADQILCDARPAPDETLPGGNGVAFDWRLVAGRTWRRPWMLAGGLTPENVGAAIRLTGAAQVDVSSGVEDAPGQKSAEKIRAFIRAAQTNEGS